MSILSGFLKTKKYRKTASGYKLQSEWTSSQTVQMDDGNTLQTNLGAIKGITSSLTSTNSSYALSAAAGKNLQDQLTLKKYTIVPTNFVPSKTDVIESVRVFSYGKIGIISGSIKSTIEDTDIVLFTLQGITPAAPCAGTGAALTGIKPQVCCSISIRTNGEVSFDITNKDVTYRFLCVFPIE